MRCLKLAALAVEIVVAQTPSFTGRVETEPGQMSWSRMPAPAAVMIELDDYAPSLKHSGIVVDAHGEHRSFEFAGATDGEGYTAVRASGARQRRPGAVGPYAILTSFNSNDGGHRREDQDDLVPWRQGPYLSRRDHRAARDRPKDRTV